MVCQAASQTRFRALKYENGIAGSATIVVRVIACFQPLQDCQAEYFRHLLKPLQVNCHFNCYNIRFLVIVLVKWEKAVDPGFLSSDLIANHPS
ncbi:hypothetical protein V6N13_120571 [Hibiscus sabdariffa]